MPDVLGICQKIWADVLEMPDVAPDDDFWELGGHSLLAVRVVGKVEAELGIAVPAAELFDTSTPRDFARLAGTVLAENGSPVPAAGEPQAPGPTGRSRRVSLGQEGSFGARERHAVPYTLSYLAFSVSGPFDHELARKAVQILVDRHEILHSRLTRLAGQSGPVVLEPLSGVTARVGWESDPGADPVLWVQSKLKPFDLFDPPLFRVEILSRSTTDHVLAVIFDHIICDGWTLRLLLEQFSACYEALATGRQWEPPPAPMSFADWAQRQRAELTEAHLTAACDRLRALLGADPSVIAVRLPGYQVPDEPSEGSRVSCLVDTQVVAGVLAQARRLRVSRFAVLLAAVSRCLARDTGLSTVGAITSHANRRTPAEELVLGPLFHFVHIRVDTGQARSMPAMAQVTQRAIADALRDGEVPNDIVRSRIWPGFGQAPRRLPNLYVAFDEPWADGLRLPAAATMPLEVDEQYPPNCLEIWAEEQAGHWKLIVRYEHNRYPAGYPVTLLDAIRAELAAFSQAGPSAPAGRD
jgi:acyl carrier protein